MNKYFKLKLFLKTKGIILFVFFLLIIFLTPQIVSGLFSYFSFNSSLYSFFIDKKFLLIVQFLFFISTFIYFCSKKYYINFISKENLIFSFQKSFFPAIIAFVSGFLGAYFFILISQILPIPQEIKNLINIPNPGFIEMFDSIDKKNQIIVIFWFLYLVVCAPIVEEILFRGFLQDSLGRIINKYKLDLIITALIFSLSHLPSWSNVVFAFIIGYFLSKQRKLNSSINQSIIMHGLINCTGLVIGIITHYSIF